MRFAYRYIIPQIIKWVFMYINVPNYKNGFFCCPGPYGQNNKALSLTDNYNAYEMSVRDISSYIPLRTSHIKRTLTEKY